jgi:hypothetical protein
MWEFLRVALSAIPSAASNWYALGAYTLAIAAYVITVWRVARNKNLLANIQKLPPKDRLSALEIETGGVRLAAGISPEQWVRSRIHRYYLVPRDLRRCRGSCRASRVEGRHLCANAGHHQQRVPTV